MRICGRFMDMLLQRKGNCCCANRPEIEELRSSLLKLGQLVRAHEREHQCRCDGAREFYCDLHRPDGLLEHARSLEAQARDYWLMRGDMAEHQLHLFKCQGENRDLAS